MRPALAGERRRRAAHGDGPGIHVRVGRGVAVRPRGDRGPEFGDMYRSYRRSDSEIWIRVDRRRTPPPARFVDR